MDPRRQGSLITSSTLLGHPTESQLGDLVKGASTKCCICLETLSETTSTDEVVFHNQRHTFHLQCFHDWFTIKLKTGSVPCPMCREETLRIRVRLRRLFFSQLYSPAERVRLLALMTGLIFGWLTVIVAMRFLRRLGFKMKPQGELSSPVTLVGIILTYTFGVGFGRVGELAERILIGRFYRCPALVAEALMWGLLLTEVGPDYRGHTSRTRPSYGRLGRQLGQAFALRGNSDVNQSYSSVFCTILGGWSGALLMKHFFQPCSRHLADQAKGILTDLLKAIASRQRPAALR
eukprot:gb/GEZN01010485.1/.p1 GENE.gb/GEZN01010485.1/~~gb/GEZN01010485.1/.p1  ORF type:complete len:291 (-),score=11.20 gb/GEZN01010485.1/:155-1027(-)